MLGSLIYYKPAFLQLAKCYNYAYNILLYVTKTIDI